MIIHSIYIGQPKDITDEQGTWRSSIYRTLASGPVEVELRGLAGDQVTSPIHGSLDSAICCHPLDHYEFWNQRYGMKLQPGNVGENWTLSGANENDICIGDVYRVGTATVQVSAPRIPCKNQARRVGRSDWIELTLKEVRPGFYMRVLQPGIVQAGDPLDLKERINPGVSLETLNRFYYHAFEPELALRYSVLPGLSKSWKERLLKKASKTVRQ